MLRVRTAVTGWTGGPGLYTFYFETPLQNVAAATRVVEYVHHFLFTPISSLWPTSVDAQVSGDVDVIDPATGAITDVLSTAAPAVVTGAGGASLAPPSSAALLRLSTSTFIAGRRVTGRIFISPLAAAVVTADGVLGNTSQGYLDAAYTAWAAYMAAGDFLVVWHRPKAGAGGAAAQLTGTSAPFKLAVLTSRRD